MTHREADLAPFHAVESELDTRWPESILEPTLKRIAALVDLLGQPQRAYPVLHVAGTNGKTSTARMLDALLTRLGLRTGRYTSPHLQSVTERIVLDGAPITPGRYAEVYQDVVPYVELVDGSQPVRMSRFEVLTAMGFAAFADAPVAAAVVEVGLGGTWDATNVADGAVCVVTPIGVDHVEYLGSDITGIAREKAGIVKPDSIAVLAAQQPEVMRVLLGHCATVGATVAREGVEFGVLDRQVAVGGQLLALQGLGRAYDEVFLPLHGAHQAGNAALALAAAEAFFGAGARRALDIEAVREAFAAVRVPARLEAVRSAPTVLLDAAHNPHGAEALAAALRAEFEFRALVGVVGVMRDKDVRGLLGALEPVLDEVVVTRSSVARALEPDALAGFAVDVFGADRVSAEPRLDDALEGAIRLAEEVGGPGDPIAGAGVLVTGSVALVGEARTLLGKEPA